MADPLDWYEAGIVHGIAIGRQQVEDEWRGRMEVSAAVARMVAGAVPYAELCDRRGEHDRADRQRTILRDRGVAA
ncbi:hypothetical protein [Cellulomonas sp. URHB0016]